MVCVRLNSIQRWEVFDVPRPASNSSLMTHKTNYFIKIINFVLMYQLSQTVFNDKLCACDKCLTIHAKKKCDFLPFSVHVTVIVCASSTSSWCHTGLSTTVLSASVCVSWCPSCRKPLWASLFSTCVPSAWTGQCFHTPHCFIKSHQPLTCDGPQTLFSFSLRSFYNVKEAIKFFVFFS